MAVEYYLHEASVGYALFQAIERADTISVLSKELNASVQDLSKFRKYVKLISFAPFAGAAQALENANLISEGICSEYLSSFLEVNLPKAAKSHSVTLGVTDKTLAGSIKNVFPHVECETAERSPVVSEMLRGIRLHAPKLIPELQEGDLERGQLGLAHAYSRARVKFSVQRHDQHIIQAIATLDKVDQAANSFSMRLREWYSWTYPELARIVDNYTYAKVILFVKDKKRLTDDDLHDLASITEDAEVAQTIIDSAKISMGRDISESDMETVIAFAERVVSLTEYRRSLHAYLVSKMSVVAPNLAALIGEVVGARLISHAGSLTNLAKYPASTVQILGAEKALFRALKTKGNTPKYGLLYHASFIGKAAQKNKGRISRFLANKCSIASRIDNFSDTPTKIFGDALRRQVEERLEFYNTGAPPTKNTDVMKSAMDSLLASIEVADPTADADVEMVDVAPRAVQKQEKKQKDRAANEDTESRKKRKHKDLDAGATVEKERKKTLKHEGADVAGDKKAKEKEKKHKKEKKEKKEKRKKHADDSD